MKKFISVIIVLTLLIAMIPATVVSADAPLSYEGYTVVNSKAELKALNGQGGNFVLGSDIDMGGEVISGTWITLKGVLDGNGHSITNFSLKATGNNTGLFLQGGDLTIRNLTIGSADALIDVTQAEGNTALIWVGTVVRFVQWGALSFENVHVYSNIHDLTASYVGGFTACNRDVNGAVTFTNCTMNGNISCGLQAHESNQVGVGGFIGTATNGSISFAQCINNADITKTDVNRDAKSAGFIGFANISATVTNCINNGNVNGYLFASGLFGQLYGNPSVVINGMWNRGNITIENKGDTEMFAGSLLGRAQNITKMEIRDVVNSGTITASSNWGVLGFNQSGGNTTVTNFATLATTDGTYKNKSTVDQINAEGFMTDFRKIYGDFTAELTPVTSFAKTAVAGWQDKTTDGSTDMRFVGYVDCLGYDAVGFRFEIAYNGRTETVDSGKITTVFQTITGGGETYTAQTTEYRNGYLYAYVIEGVPTGVTYKVTPYYVIGDTTVNAQTVTVTR